MLKLAFACCFLSAIAVAQDALSPREMALLSLKQVAEARETEATVKLYQLQARISDLEKSLAALDAAKKAAGAP